MKYRTQEREAKIDLHVRLPSAVYERLRAMAACQCVSINRAIIDLLASATDVASPKKPNKTTG